MILESMVLQSSLFTGQCPSLLSVPLQLKAATRKLVLAHAKIVEISNDDESARLLVCLNNAGYRSEATKSRAYVRTIPSSVCDNPI
jgi:hypothetical protein